MKCYIQAKPNLWKIKSKIFEIMNLISLSFVLIYKCRICIDELKNFLPQKYWSKYKLKLK